MDFEELSTQKRRYRYFAFIVIRDAIAFYFGIPKFLNKDNLYKVIGEAYVEKVKTLKIKKGRELTEEERIYCLNEAKRIIAYRIKELQFDLEYSNDVLFKDNLWLELLNLDESFFRRYFKGLDQYSKDKLAIIPKWKTRDHSLGRPYINDNFSNDITF